MFNLEALTFRPQFFLLVFQPLIVLGINLTYIFSIIQRQSDTRKCSCVCVYYTEADFGQS